MIYALMSGMVAALSLVVAMAFMRSYRRTHDHFFMYFAAAFLIFGLTQLMLGIFNVPELNLPLSYVPRLLTSVLILTAILGKNRRTRARLLLHPPADLQAYQRRRVAR